MVVGGFQRWRGRRQALRARSLRARGTDRFEDLVAWVLLSCAAGVVLLAMAVGQAGAAHTSDRSRAEAAARTPARAELLEDVDGAVLADGTRSRNALARWTGPDGRVAQGRVVVTSQHIVGDIVLDLDGPHGQGRARPHQAQRRVGGRAGRGVWPSRSAAGRCWRSSGPPCGRPRPAATRRRGPANGRSWSPAGAAAFPEGV